MQCGNLGPQKVTQATKISSSIGDALRTLIKILLNFVICYSVMNELCEYNNII